VTLDNGENGEFGAKAASSPFGRGFRLSDQNLFPEALALVPKQVISGNMVQQVEQRCQAMDSTTQNMVETILGDFGELLLMQDIQQTGRLRNQESIGLINELAKVQSSTQFFKVLKKMKLFCRNIL